MGSFVGGVVAQGLCCCFSCCCKQCSEGVTKLLGQDKTIKVFYVLLVLIFVIPSIFIFFFLHRWQSFLSFFSPWLSCPTATNDSFECIGASAIYRLSLSLFILFFLMFLLNFCSSKLALVVNEGCFCFKYMLVIAIFISFLFVPNYVFQSYSEVSKYIAIVYMAIQTIILIDLFYLAGIKLVKKYDAGQSCCGVFLVALFLIVESAAIILNVFGYITFPADEKCGNTLWLNIVTTILIALLPFTQLFNFNKQNSLLSTALISLLVSYLSFIGQYSYTESDLCQRITVPSFIFDIIVSTLLFVLTMYGSVMGGSPVTPKEVKPAMDDGSGVEREERDKETQQTKNYDDYSWVKWHFYMCLAMVYVGMLITNWTSSSIIDGKLLGSGIGFWVRVVIAWLTALLYIWTLIAPKLCPQRDFVLE